MTKHILVLGGGYGGVQTALELRRNLTADAARITLVNRHGYHQLITELHLPAAGRKDDNHVQLPLAELLKGKRVDLVFGEITQIKADEERVLLADGTELAYDILVVGLGSETEFFGIPGLQEHSFILKSVADAKKIREHVQNCLQLFKQTGDKSYTTFVVGGAGLTGIELVGEFADMVPAYCKQYGIDPAVIELYSVEAAPSILPGFPENLVDRARKSLEARGVRFITGVPVVQMEEGAAHLKDGRTLNTRTLVWTGGVRGHSVVANSGLAVDGRGRAQVNEYLQSTSNPHVFLVGDSAIVMNAEQGRPFPPTAQLAGKMGIQVGRNIYAMLKGAKMDVFTPHLSGTLASLGYKDAIGMVGDRKIQVTGKPASILKTGSKLRWLYDIGGLFTRAK